MSYNFIVNYTLKKSFNLFISGFVTPLLTAVNIFSNRYIFEKNPSYNFLYNSTTFFASLRLFAVKCIIQSYLPCVKVLSVNSTHIFFTLSAISLFVI